jgi:hypothetical protein
MGRHNASNTLWTPEAVEYVRKRAVERWSASRIAKGLKDDLGLEFSYNAVIGKADRENISLIAHIWPVEAAEMFRKLAGQGHSAPVIANKLQAAGFNLTRRNVSDKARTERIKLTPFLQERKPVPPPPRPVTKKYQLIESRLVADADWADHESPPLPLSRPTTLLELKSHQCKWPLGRNDDGDRLFCGAFKLGGRYCTHHHATSIPERMISNGQKEEQLVG